MLDSLPDDVLFIILESLNMCSIARFSEVCNYTQSAYQHYRRYYLKSKAGVAKLYPHQVNMINWVTEKLVGPARLVCKAYMSAGKTLVAYESALRLIADTGKYALVLVPPTVINVWVSEAEKHYPDLVSSKDVRFKRILFDHGIRPRDHLYVGLNLRLGGKIVVSTPAAVNMDIVSKASLIICDEAHRMVTSYNKFYGYHYNIPFLFLTAGKCNIAYTDKLTIKSSFCRFPELRHRIVRSSGNFLGVINEELGKMPDTHVVVVASNKDAYDTYKAGIVGRNVIQFYKKGKRAYQKFKKEGGALLTTIKVIAEGNNLNHCSSAIIVHPFFCTMSTIQQCVGRFYRESNVHPLVNIVFVTSGCYDTTWARCRLGVTSYSGFDAKDDSRVANVVRYLKEKGYDPDKLTDVEALCVLAVNKAGDLDMGSLDISTNMDHLDFMRCMMA